MRKPVDMHPLPIYKSAPGEVMPQFVIYKQPKDYPEGYVMRRWSIVRGSRGPVSGGAAYAKTLAELRKLVPRDMVCITRSPDDDPTIVEVWT